MPPPIWIPVPPCVIAAEPTRCPSTYRDAVPPCTLSVRATDSDPTWYPVSTSVAPCTMCHVEFVPTLADTSPTRMTVPAVVGLLRQHLTRIVNVSGVTAAFVSGVRPSVPLV